MGHLAGKEITVGFNLNDALHISKSFWSENADFINSYSQENIAYLLEETVIHTEKINSNQRILQKDLSIVKEIFNKKYPDTNKIQVLPLGIFAWNRYDGKLLNKTKTSKEYRVITNYSKEYVENFDSTSNEDIEFITKSKKKAENQIMNLAFKAVNEKIKMDRYNNRINSVFNYGRFLENFPSKSYFFKDRIENEFFILNEKNQIINQVEVKFTQSKNKLNQLSLYNKLVLPMKAYALSFDAYIG